MLNVVLAVVEEKYSLMQWEFESINHVKNNYDEIQKWVIIKLIKESFWSQVEKQLTNKSMQKKELEVNKGDMPKKIGIRDTE